MPKLAFLLVSVNPTSNLRNLDQSNSIGNFDFAHGSWRSRFSIYVDGILIAMVSGMRVQNSDSPPGSGATFIGDGIVAIANIQLPHKSIPKRSVWDNSEHVWVPYQPNGT